MINWRSLLLAAALACLGVSAFGQSAATPAAKTDTAAEAARKKRLMPEPLDGIESNLRDLEEEGKFSIVSGSYGYINNGRNQAVVWSVRANQTLTCAYIMRRIELLSDVRLYKTLGTETNEPSLQEVHSMRLYFSPKLEERAATGRLFFRDDFFEIWVYLEPVEVRKIRSLSADRAIFRAPKRR